MRRALQVFAISTAVLFAALLPEHVFALSPRPAGDQVLGTAQSDNAGRGVPGSVSDNDDAPADTPEFTERLCTVSSVHDGDSMRARCPGFRGTVRIRLHQIDAPELDQPHGTQSRERLRSMCRKDQTVIVRDYGADGYGRIIGRVYCDGVDVNAAMVEAGAAWVYDHHATDKQLYILQDQARDMKRGLWSTAKEPVAPWDHRYGQRQQERQRNTR